MRAPPFLRTLIAVLCLTAGVPADADGRWVPPDTGDEVVDYVGQRALEKHPKRSRDGAWRWCRSMGSMMP